jgi:hypothetical protein
MRGPGVFFGRVRKCFKRCSSGTNKKGPESGAFAAAGRWWLGYGIKYFGTKGVGDLGSFEIVCPALGSGLGSTGRALVVTIGVPVVAKGPGLPLGAIGENVGRFGSFVLVFAIPNGFPIHIGHEWHFPEHSSRVFDEIDQFRVYGLIVMDQPDKMSVHGIAFFSVVGKGFGSFAVVRNGGYRIGSTIG